MNHSDAQERFQLDVTRLDAIRLDAVRLDAIGLMRSSKLSERR